MDTRDAQRSISPPSPDLRPRPRRAWPVRVGACLLILLAACARPAAPPAPLLRTEPLRPPFDVEQRRALFGQDVGRITCPPPTPAVRDVLVDGFYVDRDSVAATSPEASARYQEAIRPITVFESQVASLSDAFIRGRPAAPAAARCVLEWLEAWAAEGGLLGQVNQQGQHERRWALSAVAWSYVKVQGERDLDPAKRRRVEEWIRRLAAEVVGYTDRRAGTDARNSHAYWAAAGAMASAVALNDRTLFAWSVERYRAGVAQIQPDGTLPLEMARKSRARHFHNFALAPLVLIAETAARNDVPLYPERQAALARLADRVIIGLDDPTFFERATGARQEWVGGLSGGSIPWTEPYYARFRDARLAPWLARYRPIRHRWFAGDATLCFGVKAL